MNASMAASRRSACVFPFFGECQRKLSSRIQVSRGEFYQVDIQNKSADQKKDGPSVDDAVEHGGLRRKRGCSSGHASRRKRGRFFVKVVEWLHQGAEGYVQECCHGEKDVYGERAAHHCHCDHVHQQGCGDKGLVPRSEGRICQEGKVLPAHEWDTVSSKEQSPNETS